MAHCTKCGAAVADNAGFCGSCGDPQAVATSSGTPSPLPTTVNPTAQSQMAENLAATLSYALGWLTGLIFFLIDKRPFVRFHAAQSILLSIAIFVVYFAIFVGFGLFRVIGLGFLLIFIWPLVGLAIFALWLFMMYKAYQHEKFML